ncbi:MAG: T9SS type A sorting domain-containing protein [Bacteroidota bacterium]
MKKNLLFIMLTCLISTAGMSQVFLDEFDNGDASNMGGVASYSFSEENGELTITANNTGPWDSFSYNITDPTTGDPMTLDMTGNNKIFIRVKASNVGTQFRVDVQDVADNTTTLNSIVKTLTTDFMVLEFDFTDKYLDGGFGGTGCSGDAAPCPVDGTQISRLVMYTNPGSGGFSGSLVIDYISFGEESAGEIVSDVFQDHFDKGDSSITNFGTVSPGYTLSVDGSELTVSGDGSTAMWDPLGYTIRNQNTFEPIDIDVTENNKLFIKVKSSVEGTALRIDVEDIDGFVNTQGSVTKIVGTEYQILEYDYTGTYSDLGFGGTPCTQNTAPCPVDGSRIATLVIFIEPGVGGFLGDLTFDYISFGKSLEPGGIEAELLYGDHFSNETIEFTTPVAGLETTEVESDLVITGDGTAPPFATVSYLLHDKEEGEQIVVDMGPARNKVFVKAKTDGANVPLRIDLIDTTGLTSSSTSLTKIVSGEYTILEYDFSAAADGGFGGTPCEVGPCLLDLSAINQVLFYPNPIEGEFNGTMSIDYFSIGQPLDDEEVDLGPTGLVDYSDQFNENSTVFTSDPSGLVTSFSEEALNIAGDGTGGAFSPIVYTLHNSDGEAVLGNIVGSNNKLFIRAKSSVDSATLRIDVQDNQGFTGNANSVATMLTNEYMVYELDYTNAYADGGFGGTPCAAEDAPCDVDGLRIAQLQFFIEPGTGMFNGTIDIDWISFGQTLELPAAGVVDYMDELPNGTIDHVTDMSGLVSTFADSIWTITGDGSGGAFSPVVYEIHDEAGEAILANALASENKVYVRAKADVENTELRIDLQDYNGFVTNASSKSNTLTSDFAVYEFDYTDAYLDGGFGGTPCASANAPCAVDAERIAQVQFFINPGTGGFNGVLEIDWISFGMPLTTNVIDHSILNELRVFPNPFKEQLFLEYNLKKAAEVQVEVFNVYGQQVWQQALGRQSLGTQNERLEIQTLTPGIYIVKLNAAGSAIGSFKVLKH